MTNNPMILSHPATCGNCHFTTTDLGLLKNHSCDIEEMGGQCEDYPCCGHEAGDCNGLKYGSDEAIGEAVRAHFGCEHDFGICLLDEEDRY